VNEILFLGSFIQLVNKLKLILHKAVGLPLKSEYPGTPTRLGLVQGVDEGSFI
jgi:hypothetical protein